MWNTPAIIPDTNRRIVALYDDGSGALFFYVNEDRTLRDEDGDEWPASRLDDFSMWANLPDDFKLWFEADDEQRVDRTDTSESTTDA